jgi:GNAT superfamily N-acetyltransferase
MPETGFRIRRARVDEAGIVVSHRRAMFEEMREGSAEALDRMQETSLGFFARALADGTYAGWFAENEAGAVIAGGGVLLTPWPSNPREVHLRRATVLNVYTEPAYRRQRIARGLMETMLEWCREQGFASVNLHASEFGRRLYEEMGFVPTNEMRLTFQAG